MRVDNKALELEDRGRWYDTYSSVFDSSVLIMPSAVIP